LALSGVEVLPEGVTLIEDALILLGVLEVEDAVVSLLVTDDLAMAELNEKWRGVAGTTDVLSFPQVDHFLDLGSGTQGELGDIAISLERAEEQAAQRGHSVHTELRILLVHGICHLLGHDHYDAVDAKRMRQLENRLLRVIYGSENPVIGLIEWSTVDG